MAYGLPALASRSLSPGSRTGTLEKIDFHGVSKSKLASFALELQIDSSDAFDYENPDNAKYTVDDLRLILHKEVMEI